MKITNCPNCGGEVVAECIGWKCKRCNGLIDMDGNFRKYIERPFMPQLTNADHMRSMTDEELAELLHEAMRERCYLNCEDEEIDCEDCFLEWLKQPYEG